MARSMEEYPAATTLEQRMRLTVDAALDAVITMDARGLVTDWNPKAQAMFGWSRHEAVGARLSELIIPLADREAHETGVRKFVATGRGSFHSKRVQLTGRRRNGEEFPIELAVTPLREGETYSFSAFIRDITERKRTEARLAAQYAAVSILAGATSLEETAPALLKEIGAKLSWDRAGFWVPVPGQEFLRCVATWVAPEERDGGFEKATRSLRLRPGQGLPGQVWATGEAVWIEDILTQPDLPRRKSAAEAGLRTGLGVPVRVGGRILAVIELFLRGVGTRDDSLLQTVEAIAGQVGQFLHRLETDEAVHDSEERLRLLVENALDAVVSMDTDGKITGWNARAEAMFGWSRAEVAGRQVVDTVIPRRYRAAHRKGLRRFLKTGEGPALNRRLELSAVRRSGEEFPVELSITPLRLHGESVVFSAFVRDITQRKRDEHSLRQAKEELEQRVAQRTAELALARDQALEANRAKSAFLANMSHELRTPLNAILGYSEMLHEEAETQGDQQAMSDLQRIQSAGKHLLELINDVLDLSKIESGRMDVFLETFDVRRLVDDVVRLVEPLVAKSGNELTVHFQEEPVAMRADQTKVRQTLLNLLSNASRFTSQGRIALDVRGYAKEGQRWVSFRIADTGIGMTEEQLGRIFQPFSQADVSTTRKYGGTGLGLTISRRFCELMGGDIEVETRPGEGSAFTVRLPVYAGPEWSEAESRHDEACPVDLAPGPRGTVLVIDDDPVTRQLMHRLLVGDGFRVELAGSGMDGLWMARENRPDVITLDVLMPGMDGWSVLAALQGDPTTAEIPVVMLTVVDDRKLGYALGASDYLTKPIERERLRAVLERHRPSSSGAHVLIIDDDEAARRLLRRILEGEGCAVSEAPNGRAGLEHLHRSAPSLVILDLVMPEMDGFEFVDEVRKNLRWAALPIVVVTAKKLTDEERQRLAGRVRRIIRRRGSPPDKLLEQVRQAAQAARRLAAGSS